MYDEAQDAIAAEYVLGTLSGDERAHAETLLTIDPGFAEAVRVWERRLGELNVMVEAVEPPPEVWNKIRAEIGDVASASEIPLAFEVAPPGPQTETAKRTEALSKVAELSSVLLSSSTEAKLESAPTLADSLGAPSAELSSLAAPNKLERGAEVVYLTRRVRRWRRMTAAVGAIAALLAIFVAVTLFSPGLIPWGRFLPAQFVAQSQPPVPLGGRFVAVLQQEPTAPAFLLTIDPHDRTLIVRRVSATPESGRSYELWLISSRFPQPRSLGVVGNDEFTRRAIPANFDVDTMRGASYAVSLEPAGGSQSGQPTGPILFTGKLVEAVPAPATPHT